MKIFFVLTALKVDCDQFIVEFYNYDNNRKESQRTCRNTV